MGAGAYVYNFIFVQSSLGTRSSSVITLAQPPASSFKITNCPFRYASPSLSNILTNSFCQPNHCHSSLHSLHSTDASSSSPLHHLSVLQSLPQILSTLPPSALLSRTYLNPFFYSKVFRFSSLFFFSFFLATCYSYSWVPVRI